MYVWERSRAIDSRERIGVTRHRLDGKQIPHGHEFVEIEYVAEGSVVQIINDTIYECKEGDFFVISVGDQHCFYTKGPAEIVNLDFYQEILGEIFTEEFFVYRKQKMKNVINVGDEKDKALRLLLMIEDEFAAKREGYVYAMHCALKMLLAILMRHGRGTSGELSGGFEDCVEQYLTETSAADWDLMDMAKLCGYTRSGFSRRFKVGFGCSPLEYVNRKKVNVALKMLLASDEKIESVMESVGFYNKSHFYDLFFRYTGIKPNDVRKINRLFGPDGTPAKRL